MTLFHPVLRHIPLPRPHLYFPKTTHILKNRFSNINVPFQDDLNDVDLDEFGLGDFKHYVESPDVKRYREEQLQLPRDVDEYRQQPTPSSSHHHHHHYQGALEKTNLAELAQVQEPAIFVSKFTDPYLNLAIEDYIYNHMPSNHPQRLLFYTNRPCVVIGKNQNPWKEVNLPLLNKLNLPLIRRRSGGGTVAHDLGNVNYSFMTSKNEFDRFTFANLITECLDDARVKVNKRGDIVTVNQGQEYKISGSAYKISRGKSYHHGTMLLDSDLARLKSLLHRDEGVLGVVDAQNSVDSVKSKVTNLGISSEEFVNRVGEGFERRYGMSGEPMGEGERVGGEKEDEYEDDFHAMMGLTDFAESPVARRKMYEISKEQTHLPETVFSTAEELKAWSWKFGHTPSFTHTLTNGELDLVVKFSVNKGKITNVEATTASSTTAQALEHILDAARAELESKEYTSKTAKRAFAGTELGDCIGAWLEKTID
ncbi:uncharacterized protein LODBEIA_P22570 [Lodderomyces beijingensis]|uniref:Putative lipoate-protein ligase A n=1 Tax=Lodderomyces beijingensis TaxID=1775926 RepID=A0ABP0ZIR6_9ASCO